MHKKLEAFLTDRIRNSGPVDLSDFIDLSLTHPQFGYYRHRDPLGCAGDFTTAPEVSQLFGEMVAVWIIDLWIQMDRPAFNLIEFGPGRATLMSDIQRVGRGFQGFTDATHIRFIEVSETLKIQQKEKLQGSQISWHDDLPSIPTDQPAIIIGNEFLDVLSIEQLKRTEKGWLKCAVNQDKNHRYVYDWVKADDGLQGYLPNHTVSNVVYEISPARFNFIDECAQFLKQSGGAALFIDYGHVRSHFGDTFQAIRKHQFVDPLEEAGLCDLTSHVDFEPLRAAIHELDLKSPECVTQGAFLNALGLSQRIGALQEYANKMKAEGQVEKADKFLSDLESSSHRLTAADQMGDLFKVMCFYAGYDVKPVGFDA